MCSVSWLSIHNVLSNLRETIQNCTDLNPTRTGSLMGLNMDPAYGAHDVKTDAGNFKPKEQKGWQFLN